MSWYETDGGWAVDGFFFADDAEEIAGPARAALQGTVDIATITVEPVPEDVDWVAQSLEGLSPVIAGRFVVHGAHDRDRIPKGLIGLQIEANQAFGTGHHPTTWGCLTALTRLLAVYRFDSVFDLGTGSGVLAIGIALATKRPVLASDIDPLAVEIALENAGINGAANLVTAVTAAGFAHPAIVGRKFDLIVANILGRSPEDAVAGIPRPRPARCRRGAFRHPEDAGRERARRLPRAGFRARKAPGQGCLEHAGAALRRLTNDKSIGPQGGTRFSDNPMRQQQPKSPCVREDAKRFRALRRPLATA